MLKDFSKENYDIIIQAGQSNSEGFGFGKTDAPYEPNDRVWYMNRRFTISRAGELVIKMKFKVLALEFADYTWKKAIWKMKESF